MSVFCTMESVRDQVKGVCRVRPVNVPLDRNRYPCDIERQCVAKGESSCVGHVVVYVAKPSVSVVTIEIIFFRHQRLALMRVGNRHLQKLIEHGIVDPSRLVQAM